MLKSTKKGRMKSASLQFNNFSTYEYSQVFALNTPDTGPVNTSNIYFVSSLSLCICAVSVPGGIRVMK